MTKTTKVLLLSAFTLAIWAVAGGSVAFVFGLSPFYGASAWLCGVAGGALHSAQMISKFKVNRRIGCTDNGDTLAREQKGSEYQKGERMISSIDGTEVTVKPCEHCDQRPSDDEIRTAVERAKTEWRPKCAVCDGTFKLFAVQLYHYKEAAQDRWATRTTRSEGAIEFYSHGAAGNLVLHIDCAIKAMPHKNWDKERKLLGLDTE